jgi:hypothetical protein
MGPKTSSEDGAPLETLAAANLQQAAWGAQEASNGMVDVISAPTMPS